MVVCGYTRKKPGAFKATNSVHENNHLRPLTIFFMQSKAQISKKNGLPGQPIK
jgi:hypothetical protein